MISNDANAVVHQDDKVRIFTGESVNELHSRLVFSCPKWTWMGVHGAGSSMGSLSPINMRLI